MSDTPQPETPDEEPPAEDTPPSPEIEQKAKARGVYQQSVPVD
jgi:hypothetical protein